MSKSYQNFCPSRWNSRRFEPGKPEQQAKIHAKASEKIIYEVKQERTIVCNMMSASTRLSP